MSVSSQTSRRIRGLAAPTIAVLAMVATALPAFGVEPGATDAAAAARGTVRTKDGLALTVNTNGTVGAVRDGSRTLPHTPAAGGFSVRMAGNQPNLLHNAGFESSTSSWSFPSSGSYRPTIVTSGAHSGRRSARINIPGSSLRTSGRATQTVRVTPGEAYVVSGYSKTVKVAPSSMETTAQLSYRSNVAPAKIRIEMLDSRGRATRAIYAYSYTGNSGWSKQAAGVRAKATETQLRVALVVEGGRGTVWFDDLSVSRLLASSSSSLTGTSTRFRPNGPGTADDKVTQSSNISGHPLRLTATYETFKDENGAANGLHVLGKVTHTGGGRADEGFQVTYTLPIGASGWRYGDTPRVARLIANGRIYTFDNGNLNQAARYMQATIFDSRSNISMGAPLDDPRSFTFAYDTAHGLSITFDLAVSRVATALGRAATFEIELFRASPNQAFRSAVSKYYQLNASTFARRPEITPDREGLPFYSPPLNELTQWQKLHLGLNVVGLGYGNTGGKVYAEWDEQGGRNILSAAYTHHWGLFLRPPCGKKCTYQQVAAHLNKQAAQPCTPAQSFCIRRKQEAAAAKIATARDLNGRLRFDFNANASRLREMADPSLAGGPGGINWSDAVLKFQLETARAAAAEVGASLDAIYVDSSSGMRPVWGDTDDYDRTKWSRTKLPLTFSYDSGQVTMKSFFANYLHLRRIAEWAHSRGIILVLDTNGKEQTKGGILATDMADWLLIENSLRDLENPVSQSGITTDSYALLKRVLANQRPITTVDPRLANGSLSSNPTPSTLVTDGVVSRVNQSLFYGIWPGPERWKSGFATRWWKNANYINIFNKYGPLFERLATSGWEVVTNARASTSRLWLERFGKAKDDDLIITMRNETNSALSHIKVTVDLTRDGTTAAHIGSAVAVQRVSRSGLSITGGKLSANKKTYTFFANVPARTTGLVTVDLTLIP